MRKFTLSLAALLMTGSLFAELKVEKVWEKSEAGKNKPTWITTDNQRSMDIYGENLYITSIMSGTNHVVYVIDTKDGNNTKSLDAGKAGWGGMGGVAVSDNGTLLVSRGLSATFFVNKVDSEKGGVIGEADGAGFLPSKDYGVGRIDQFNVYGDIEGATGGYLSFGGCGLVNEKHFLKIVPVANGTPNADNAINVEVPNSKVAVISCTTLPHSDKKVWVGGKSLVPRLVNIEDGSAEEFGDVKPSGNAGGMAEFTFNGKNYFVASENQMGAINIYDITSGVASATRVLEANTADLGTAVGTSFTCPIATKVADDHVMIYVFSSSNGLAAYKFYDEVAAPATEIKLPFSNDFSALDGIGATNSSSASMPNLTEANIEALGFIVSSENVGAANGKIKFATSKNDGILTTLPVNVGTAKNIKITFDATAWVQASNAKASQVLITYGDVSKEVQIEHKEKVGWPLTDDELVEYSVVFPAIAEKTPITFSSMGKNDRRFFMDNLSITESEPEVVVITETPVITPSPTTFIESVTVAISCATEGAEIRYTTDGTDPTKDAGQIYTTPFDINETTTVKAIAHKEGLTESEITSSTYTKLEITKVATIDELRKSTVNNYYQLTGEAFVTVRSKSESNQNITRHLQDATGAIVIYDSSKKLETDYVAGDGITNLMGQLVLYNDMLELVPIADAGTATSTAVEVAPVAVELSELSAHPGKLVKVSGVKIAGTGDFVAAKSYNLNDGTNPVLRTQYGDLDYIGQPIPTAEVNIIGVVINYKTTYQLVPRSLDDIQLADALNGTDDNRRNVYSAQGKIIIAGAAGERIAVYSTMGHELISTVATENITAIEGVEAGQLVIVRVGDKSTKVMVK